MYNDNPKYRVNNCFIKPKNLKMGRSPFFIIEDMKEYPSGWLYTVYYPESQEYRRYYEHRLETECQLVEDQEMPEILYGKVSL